MEMKLIERKGEIFTRFKINKRYWNKGFLKLIFKDKTSIKVSRNFIYFEVEGDCINSMKGV